MNTHETFIRFGACQAPQESIIKEVLTNPQSGFYVNSAVFREPGDFITSPEVQHEIHELFTLLFCAPVLCRELMERVYALKIIG
ncbi:unnamed protein product [Urochloa humidicola]